MTDISPKNMLEAMKKAIGDALDNPLSPEQAEEAYVRKEFELAQTGFALAKDAGRIVDYTLNDPIKVDGEWFIDIAIKPVQPIEYISFEVRSFKPDDISDEEWDTKWKEIVDEINNQEYDEEIEPWNPEAGYNRGIISFDDDKNDKE